MKRNWIYSKELIIAWKRRGNMEPWWALPERRWCPPIRLGIQNAILPSLGPECTKKGTWLAMELLPVRPESHFISNCCEIVKESLWLIHLINTKKVFRKTGSGGWVVSASNWHAWSFRFDSSSSHNFFRRIHKSRTVLCLSFRIKLQFKIKINFFQSN